MKTIVAAAMVLLGLNIWKQDNYSREVNFGIVDTLGQGAGFTFYSPNEPGWIITKNRQRVNLTKRGMFKDEGSQIEGYLIITDVPIDPIFGYIENIKTISQKILLLITI